MPLYSYGGHMISFDFKQGYWRQQNETTELVNENCSVCDSELFYPVRMKEVDCPDCQAPLIGARMIKDEDTRLAYHLGLPLGNDDEDDFDEDEYDEYWYRLSHGYHSRDNMRDMNDFHCT